MRPASVPRDYRASSGRGAANCQVGDVDACISARRFTPSKARNVRVRWVSIHHDAAGRPVHYAALVWYPDRTFPTRPRANRSSTSGLPRCSRPGGWRGLHLLPWRTIGELRGVSAVGLQSSVAHGEIENWRITPVTRNSGRQTDVLMPTIGGSRQAARPHAARAQLRAHVLLCLRPLRKRGLDPAARLGGEEVER